MREAKFGLLALMAVLAVLFVGGFVLAAETKPAKAAQKGDGKSSEKSTQESTDKAGEETAEKPAEKPAAKPAPKNPPKPATKQPDAANKAEEQPEQPLTPLEQRLKDLQQALEAATRANQRRIPKDIKLVVKYLSTKEKGLLNPETGKPIMINEGMLGKHEVTVEKPKEFITFYADQPTPNKGRAVIFGDNTIKYLSEEEFKKAIEASKPKQMTRDELRDMRDVRSFGGHEK